MTPPGSTPGDFDLGPPSPEEAALRCTNGRYGRLLLPYVLRQLSSTEEEAFEVHLLECNRCFQDLQALDRTGTLVKRYQREHPETLGPPPHAASRRRGFQGVVALGLFIAAAAAFLLGLALAPEVGDRGDGGAAPEIRSLLDDADSEILAGRSAAAERLLQQAERISKGPCEELYAVLLRRSDLSAWRGRTESAVEHLRRAEAMGSALAENALVCGAASREALIHYLRQLDPEAGREALERAKAAAENAARPCLPLFAARHGVALAWRGDVDGASRIVDELSRVAASPGVDPAWARTGSLLRGLEEEVRCATGGGEADALVRARSAYAKVDRPGTPARQVLPALLGLGRTGLLAGTPEAAVAPLTRALETGLAAAYPDLEALARASLALARLRQGRPDEAQRYLAPALSFARQSEDPWLLADLLFLEGWLHHEQERSEECRTSLEESVRHARLLPDTPVRKARLLLTRSLLEDPGTDIPEHWVPSGRFY